MLPTAVATTGCPASMSFSGSYRLLLARRNELQAIQLGKRRVAGALNFAASCASGLCGRNRATKRMVVSVRLRPVSKQADTVSKQADTCRSKLIPRDAAVGGALGCESWPHLISTGCGQCHWAAQTRGPGKLFRSELFGRSIEVPHEVVDVIGAGLDRAGRQVPHEHFFGQPAPQAASAACGSES